jgi:hypothetical protein
VGYVRLGHNQAIVASARQHATAGCSSVDGYEFPNPIAFSNARFRWFAFVLQVLGGEPNRDEGKNMCTFTHGGVSVDYTMRFQANVVGQRDFIADN